MTVRTHMINITVMSLSMLLLITLQFFWILNSYEGAVASLRRDANLLFRTTIISMNNEMWTKKLAELSSDSSASGVRVLYADSTRQMKFQRPMGKSVEVIVARKTDSSEMVGRRLLPPIRNRALVLSDVDNFLLRIQPDSLNLDTLRRLYSDALTKANILVSFELNHVRHSFVEPEHMRKGNPSDDIIIRRRDHIVVEDGMIHSPVTFASDTLHSEAFRVSPSHEYSVSLFGLKGMLFRQIMPQVLFSLFLTTMIGGAFVLMYKNLRSQERIMKSKNEFIGNISHELKTPVATVSVALEALKNFHAIDDPQRTREYLAIATAELNRLSLMTDKILKTAVFEDKGVEYEPEEVDLRNLVDQVVSSMRLVFEKNKAHVEFNAEGDNFILYGSSTHLTNVVYNLLDNALKYSKSRPLIEVLLHASATELRFSVKDNGVGIEPIYHKKVFEKFFRVPTDDVHDVKGYGLGLNYVASVVRRHGGNVWVISERRTGSEFVVSFPRKTK